MVFGDGQSNGVI